MIVVTILKPPTPQADAKLRKILGQEFGFSQSFENKFYFHTFPSGALGRVQQLQRHLFRGDYEWKVVCLRDHIDESFDPMI